MRFVKILFLSVFVMSKLASSQSVGRDLTADAILASAVNAGLSFNVSDEVFTGTGIYFDAGQQHSSAISLKLKGTTASLVEYNRGSVERREAQTVTGNYPSGQATNASAVVQRIPLHNCWIPATWFSPAGMVADALLSSMASQYIGLEQVNGAPAQHIRITRIFSQDAKTNALIADLSSTDLYFDPSTHLLLVARFNEHPDTDYGVDIPIEIRYADYRATSAGSAAYRIQRLVNYSLALDITVANVAVNTGLSSSSFTLN